MKVALIGFGEVGQILATALAGQAELSAYDTLFSRADSIPSRALGLFEMRRGENGADAASGADLVISAVTAAQDQAAAQAAAGDLKPGAIFVDLNSVSPGQKIASAAIVEAAGGRYVEAAVMSPFPPKGVASPMLLGGPHAQAFLDAFGALGFSGAKVFSPLLGQASAAKMCRSVMIKGIEALVTESLLSARRYGVDGTVLASLGDLLPLPDWTATARYMISRSLEHGVRRAEEMDEVAQTVREAGLDPLMSRAAAERQAWAPQYAAALAEDDLGRMLDAILQDIDGKTR